MAMEQKCSVAIFYFQTAERNNHMGNITKVSCTGELVAIFAKVYISRLQNMHNVMLDVNIRRVREAKLPAKEGPGRFFSRQVETAPAVSVKWPATLRNLP